MLISYFSADFDGDGKPLGHPFDKTTDNNLTEMNIHFPRESFHDVPNHY